MIHFHYILLLLCTASIYTTYSQTVNTVQNNSVRIQTKHETCVVLFSRRKTPNKLKKDRMYYAVKGNTVNSAKGGYTGHLLHGKYSSYYYGSKQPKSKGLYHKGLRKDIWIWWFENGEIRKIIPYKKGRIHGICCYFDSSGNKNGEAEYKHGRLHGDSVQTTGDTTIFQIYKKGLLQDPSKDKSSKARRNSIIDSASIKKKKLRLSLRMHWQLLKENREDNRREKLKKTEKTIKRKKVRESRNTTRKSKPRKHDKDTT